MYLVDISDVKSLLSELGLCGRYFTYIFDVVFLTFNLIVH